jgi:hypothetical protein
MNRPDRESVLECVRPGWETTHRIFLRWLGEDGELGLDRFKRDSLRAELFYVLDGLYVMRAVEKRQVDENRAEWRRRPADPEGPRDVYTHTERDAAAFERMVH